MSRQIILLLVVSFSIVTPVSLFSQTYTTISKNCGKCGKAVSASSKIGDVCPYCGVRWGYENTSKTTSTSFKTYTLSDNSNSKSLQNATITKQTKKIESEKNKNIEPNPFMGYSKAQTESWIIEKLNSYSHNFTYYSEAWGISKTINFSDFEFKFQDGYFITSYFYNDKEDLVYYVPLYDIFYVYGKQYDNNINISTNDQTMFEVNLTDKTRKTANYLKIGFQNNGEVDLIKNLEKAFIHLKSKYSKPTSNQLPDFTPKRIIAKPTISATKEWILEKLNNYKLNVLHPSFFVQTPDGLRDISSSNNNFSFEFFNDEWLTIKCYSSNQQLTVQIPICDVSINRKYPSGNTTNANLQFYSSYKKIMASNGYVNEFLINIDLTREQNLEERLLKAFANLKSYCHVVQRKETF